MKEYSLEIKVKNNLLKRRRLDAGYKSAAAFCRVCNIPLTEYCSLERMTRSPLNRRHEMNTGQVRWRKIAKKIADFYGVSPFDLFPQAALEPRNRSAEVEVTEDEIRALSGEIHNAPSLPDDTVSKKETLQEVVGLIDFLPVRQQYIIQQRFGAERQLKDIGDELGITKERVRTLQEEALRTIRANLYAGEEYI